MGQGKSSSQSHANSFKNAHQKDRRYMRHRLEAIKNPFEVVDPLIPNGLFPPEVLELILMHLDPPSLAKVIISCKLWLQTSDRLFKHTYQHRYVMPHNIDLSTFNAREEVFKQHLIEQQMAEGNCWMQVLSQEYDSGRLRTSFQYKWSHFGNLIAITKEKKHHSSYGSSTTLAQTWLVDMATGAEKEIDYGVQFVGGVQVKAKPSEFAEWNWEEFYYDIREDNPVSDERMIKRKNKFIRQDTHDPWHTLRAPARMMDGLANLDGSPQVLIYDRNTAQRRGLDTFTIETWNVTNGAPIHEIKLDHVGDNVVGFYKESAIMSIDTSKETVFVNLTNGLVEMSFPHVSNRLSFCLAEGKIAFIDQNQVFVYDLSAEEKLLKKIDVKNFQSSQGFKFSGVALDKWKLVVSARIEERSKGYYSFTGGLLAIFDMTQNFKLLCTKYVPSFSRDEVKIACLPNGSVIVGDNALIVFDFLHHYLEKPMSVAVFSGSSKVQVAKINPLDLANFARETFKCELGELGAISYYEVPADQAPRTESNMYNYNEDYSYLNNKTNRITFIGLHQRPDGSHQSSEEVKKTIMSKFLEYWRKYTDTVAPFAFASSNLNEKPANMQTRRLDAFGEMCIMVFEKWNATKQCWEMTDPFVPKGINAELEHDV